jgi:signal transduction histidine kinase
LALTPPNLRQSPDKAIKAFKDRIRELTPRVTGRSLRVVAERLRIFMRGWKAYFRLAQTPGVWRRLDEWIRHRLRAIQLKQWRHAATILRELTALGAKPAVATRGELQRHGVVLLTDLSAGDRPVLGDKVQLQQVLLNLIMNGIPAMGAVTDRKRELTVSVAFAEPGRVQVAVEDTGPGLDPATALRIFEPFFTTKSDGLGMGLSISRSIVEAHGGQLRVSPRAPHGTALRFTIPIAGEM